MAKTTTTYVATDLRTFQNELLACMPALKRYTRHLMGRTADWEDLTQATMLKAMVFVRNYNKRPEILSAWLFRIAKNINIDNKRKAFNRYGIGGGDAFWQKVSDETYREDDPDLRIDMADLLMNMNEVHRNALMRIEVEDYLCREVADADGIPMGSVLRRVYHAREKARAMLEAA